MRGTHVLSHQHLEVWGILMRRLLVAILIGGSLAGMVWSASLAKSCSASFCVDASQNVNGDRDWVSVPYHSYAQTASTVVYNCWLGPIPFICDIYFEQQQAWYPFGVPTVVAGNVPVKSYVYGTSWWTGKASWSYSLGGSIAGDNTRYLTGRAYADTHTGSGVYYNHSGTGHGHQVDDIYYQQVVVP
jgi:hypothetical protein